MEARKEEIPQETSGKKLDISKIGLEGFPIFASNQ